MADVLTTPIAEFLRYFVERGFGQEDITRMNAVLFTAGNINELLGRPEKARFYRSAIYLPSTDIGGNSTDFYMLRGLIIDHPFGIDIPKSLCPVGVRPRAHFPKNNPPLVKGMTIYLCESVLKAEVVSKAGFYAIGVNGCWGFRDRTTNSRMLLDLCDFPWSVVREVRVCFDSNYSDNEDVKAAAGNFANILQVMQHGHVGVSVLVLPHGPDGKSWGIDDALVHHGRDWVVQLLQSETVKPDFNEMLEKQLLLNEEVVLVEENSRIVQYSTPKLISMGKHDFAQVNYADWVTKSTDSVMSVPLAWLRWSGRLSVREYDMRPNEPRVVAGEFLNRWVDPKLPDAEPSEVWHEFQENLIQNSVERSALIRWCAHLIQRPGVKMTTYAVLVGPQGTGKSTLFRGLVACLGIENCAIVGQEIMESEFNAEYSGRLFVGIDELEDKTGKIGEKLKRLSTEEKSIVNGKYAVRFVVRNCTNYGITTNSLKALKLDEDDRRAVVVDCTPSVNHVGDTNYYGRVAAEIRDNPGGIAAYYRSIDLSEFDRYAPATRTLAKMDMTEAGRTGYDQAVWDLMHNRDELFRELRVRRDGEFISVTEFALACQGAGRLDNKLDLKAHTTKMGFALKKMMFKKFEHQQRLGSVKHSVYSLSGSMEWSEDKMVQFGQLGSPNRL